MSSSTSSFRVWILIAIVLAVGFAAHRIARGMVDKPEPWTGAVATIRSVLYADRGDPAKPTLFVVAGSGALYGISTPALAAASGLTVKNFGLHAGYHPDILFSQVIAKVRSGDIVIAPLEWGTADRAIGSKFDILNYRQQFWRHVDLPKEIAAKLPSADKLSWTRQALDTLTDFFGNKDIAYMSQSEILAEWNNGSERRASFHYLSRAGDINLARPMTPATWKLDGRQPPTTFSKQATLVFSDWQRRFRAKGVWLLPTWPILLDARDRPFENSSYWEKVEAVRQGAEKNNTPYFCDPVSFVLSTIYRHDTIYHANSEGARLYSEALGRCVADVVAGRSGPAAKIDPKAAAAEAVRRLEAQRVNFGQGDMPFQRRLRVLTEVRDNLARLHSETGAYPVSDGSDGSLSAVLPDGVTLNPEDSYSYRSDGRGYKVIVVNAPLDCAVVTANWPDLIDAKTVKQEPLRCAAYGYWTPDHAKR